MSYWTLFLLSLHLRYHEIPRKEEIYSYITIIIRVLGNLIHKCTSIILRLFGISDSATLNRRHHWKKIHYIPVLLNKLQKVEGNFKRFLISSLSSASWQLMAIQEIQFHLAIKSYFFVIPIGICGHFALLYVEYTIELAK